MAELNVLDNFIVKISDNPLYRNCANGDNRLMASLCLYFCLNNQYSFANYATMKANRLFDNSDTANLTQETKDCLTLYNLEHAILAYSSCYDTILQIVYFAFHFAKDFQNEKKYHEQLNRCLWYDSPIVKDKESGEYKIKETGMKIWFGELSNDASKSLFEKLSTFYGASCRGKVNKYANAIKHKGGISIASLNSYIPDCIRVVSPITFTKKGDTFKFHLTDKNMTTFNPKILYPQEIDFKECLSMLENQNKIIYEFVEYLFNFMGLNDFNKKDIFAPKFILPFYYEN